MRSQPGGEVGGTVRATEGSDFPKGDTLTHPGPHINTHRLRRHPSPPTLPTLPPSTHTGWHTYTASPQPQRHPGHVVRRLVHLLQDWNWGQDLELSQLLSAHSQLHHSEGHRRASLSGITRRGPSLWEPHSPHRIPGELFLGPAHLWPFPVLCSCPSAWPRLPPPRFSKDHHPTLLGVQGAALLPSLSDALGTGSVFPVTAQLTVPSPAGLVTVCSSRSSCDSPMLSTLRAL